MRVIGATEYVLVGDNPNPVPAKIDTGADSTAIHATILSKPEDNAGVLRFTLFCEESEFYDGKVYETKDFREIKIRSSNGTIQERYKVNLVMEISGEKFTTGVNLSDRAKNTYSVLVGRKTLAGRFLVDPAKDEINLALKKFNHKDII